MKPDPRAEQPAANSIETNNETNSRKINSRLCRRVQNRLTAYLDGDLNVGARQDVARHLEECASCRREMRLLVHTGQILTASASGIAAPPDLRAGFYARLDAAPRQSNTWRVSAPTFAACGLVLLVSGAAYRLREAPSGNAAAAHGSGVNEPRSLATAPSSTAAGSRVGLPGDARAKLLPTAAPSPDRQIADNRAASPAAHVTPRYLSAAQPTQPARRLVAALAVKHPSATIKTAQSGRYNHRGRLIATGREAAALPPSRLVIAVKSTLSKPRGAQVAMLTRSERDDARLTERAPFGFGRIQQSAIGGRQTARSEAMDSSAANSGKQNGVPGEQASPRFTFSNNSFAAASPYFRYEGSEAEEPEGVRFEVRDAQRGFTASTRSESRMQRQNGRQVLSVHLEDQDALEPGATDKSQSEPAKTKPESDTNTGSEK